MENRGRILCGQRGLNRKLTRRFDQEAGTNSDNKVNSTGRGLYNDFEGNHRVSCSISSLKID